ncbi:copper amine oxidase N-terminal domain-containing protein [Paenibacillus sp. OAE614]|uniref:copper amine oxidase N-terminal domain-containing protein n=1 Tax=Paenibacillus sp. OAE614 TaxID=2663804 RepID=UPI00178B43F1
MRKKFWSMLILAAALVLTIPLTAGAAPAKQTPIHLKIGPYFVLYTEPSSPFIDSKNRLVVPLRSFETLMGGKVDFNNTTKKATISWLNHNFSMTLNSNQAYVDGKPMSMDTKPILKDNAIFIPIRLLLDQTDVKWASENGVVHLLDSRVIKGKIFSAFSGELESGMSEKIKNQNAITLKDYQIDLKTGGNSSSFDGKLIINAINTSSENIAKGKSDINALIWFENGTYSGEPYNKYTSPRPGVKHNGTIQRIVPLNLSSDDKISAIIAVGRSFE